MDADLSGGFLNDELDRERRRRDDRERAAERAVLLGRDEDPVARGVRRDLSQVPATDRQLRDHGAGRRSPGAELAVPSNGTQATAVGGPRDGRDRLGVTREHRDRLPTDGVPGPHGHVPTRRSEGGAIGTPRQAVDLLGVASEDARLAATRDVPEARGVVVRGRGQERAIGMPCKAGDAMGVSLEDAHLLGRLEVPESDRAVSAADREQAPAGDDAEGDDVRVRLEDERGGPGLEVPEQDASIPAGRQEATSVLDPSHRLDPILVPLEDVAALPRVSDPDANAAVVRAAGEAIPGRAPAHTARPRLVPHEALHRRALLGLEDEELRPPGHRRDPLPVRAPVQVEERRSKRNGLRTRVGQEAQVVPLEVTQLRGAPLKAGHGLRGAAEIEGGARGLGDERGPLGLHASESPGALLGELAVLDGEDADHRERDGRDREHRGADRVAPAPVPDAAGGTGRSSGDRLVHKECAQVLREGRGRGVAVLRPLLHRLRADHGELHRTLRAQRARRHGVLAQDLVGQLSCGVSLEGTLLGEQLVEHDAQAEHVGAVVDLLTPRRHLLGAHVGPGPPALAGHRLEAVVLQARETEVREPGLSVLGEQDVGGLQVAVDDALAVGGLERLGDLRDQEGGLLIAGLLLTRSLAELGDQGAQRTPARHELLSDPCTAIVEPRAVGGHDVGVNDACTGTRLALETLQAARGRTAGQDQLEGHRPPQLQVRRTPHLPHPPLAEELLQPEGPHEVPGGDRLHARALHRGRKSVRQRLWFPTLEAQGIELEAPLTNPGEGRFQDLFGDAGPERGLGPLREGRRLAVGVDLEEPREQLVGIGIERASHWGARRPTRLEPRGARGSGPQSD